MKARYRIPLSAALAVFMVAAVYFKAGIYFETNDDRLIAEILSGVIGGEPSARVVHLNYLLSLPLSWLYHMTVRVPWYGLCLVFFHVLSYFFILDAALAFGKSRGQFFWSLAMWAALFLLNIYCVAGLQFTSTAVFLALAGYFCLLLGKGRKISLVFFGLLMVFSCFLRRDSMLLVQPPGLLAYAGILLADKKELLRQKMIRFLQPCMITGGVLLLGICGNAVGYRGEEWKQFQIYNQARVEIFDYYGKPDYEEISGILDKYGVSRAEYEAYKEYIILDGRLSGECAAEIAKYAEEKHFSEEKAGIAEGLQAYLFGDDYWGINHAVFWLGMAAVIGLVVSGRYGYLIPIGLLEAGKLFAWCYLLYKGRLPFRVTIPLFLCEAGFLIAIMIKAFFLEGSIKVREKLVLWAAALLFCYMGFLSGRQEYRYVKQENTGMEIFMEGMKEVEAYCREHPDNRYLLDSVSMSYYKGSVFDTGLCQPRNSMVTGSWYSYSPVMKSAQREYLKNASEIYFITADDGRGEKHPALEYFSERTGEKAVLEDSFTASHGGKYLVYCFHNGVCFE